VHDVVVVGAGTAGCILAARLSEDPTRRVLLLEAGGSDRRPEIRVPLAFKRTFGTRFDWGYRTAPQEALAGREVLYPRGRVLGGSSSINAMMVIRGHRLDHEAWPAGWGWDDVEPSYARAAAGPFAIGAVPDPSPLTGAFLDATAGLGIPRLRSLLEPELEGAAPTPVSIVRGRRWSVVDGYLAAARRRPNLEVVTGAQVTRVLVDGGRARALVYRRDGREHEAAADSVVLAAGAIDTPRLLLLSGIGPRAELERHGIAPVRLVEGVGRGLRDHVANGIVLATRPGVGSLARLKRPRYLLPGLVRWLARGSGPLASNLAEAAAFVRTDPALRAPDLELLFAPVPILDEGLTEPDWDGVTIAAILLQPRSVGEVRLRSSDPLAAPVVDPRYLTDPGGHDRRVLLHGLRLARRVAAADPLASLLADEALPGTPVDDEDALETHLRERSQTLYHPVGTCRMGVDETAVVDPLLRVRGIEGLRVVDASAIPALPRGHTNWPVAMLAERAAVLIAAA
jgi:choline dehydrogenase